MNKGTAGLLAARLPPPPVKPLWGARRCPVAKVYEKGLYSTAPKQALAQEAPNRSRMVSAPPSNFWDKTSRFRQSTTGGGRSAGCTELCQSKWPLLAHSRKKYHKASAEGINMDDCAPPISLRHPTPSFTHQPYLPPPIGVGKRDEWCNIALTPMQSQGGSTNLTEWP